MRDSSVLFLFCTLALLLCGTVGLSEAFKLPDTGQTKCYQDVSPYAEITCPSPGSPLAQDGSYNINPKSYTVIGSNSDMVQDNNTGLIWQRQDDGNLYNWFQASGTYDATFNSSSQNVCGSLNVGGYADWRVPSEKELITIVDYSIPYPGPTINASYFPNTQQSNYWASTTEASSPAAAWFVAFFDGVVGGHSKDGSDYVRCVRAGQLNFGNFQDNGNGTVTDKSTGLMWQQGEPGTMLWGAALDYCEGLTLPSGGYSDWRLPNIIELESITDDTVFDPVNHPIAIDTNAFPNAVAFAPYRSSTTDARAGGSVNAWTVTFFNGFVGPAGKVNPGYYVRCVRGGQSGSLGNLTISKTGTGSGTVVSSPAGINCGGTCSAYFPINSAVALDATPSTGGSIFSGWSGDSDCADGIVTLSADKSCTATFDLCDSASIARTVLLGPFSSINDAYVGAASTDTIRIIASNQQEGDLVFSGKNLTLQGGYDCVFTEPPTSFTTITGSLTISGGSVSIGEGEIRIQ